MIPSKALAVLLAGLAIGSAAADDAERDRGVTDIAMPCTPERVWRAIHAGDGADETTGAAMPHFDPSTGTEGTVDRTTGGAQ